LRAVVAGWEDGGGVGPCELALAGAVEWTAVWHRGCARRPIEEVSRVFRAEADVFRAEDVTKVFGNGFKANDGLSLAVEPGEVYGLLGPNGAGKSTFVKQVIGLLKPTSGSIALGAADLVAHPDLARQRCSYLPQAQLPIDAFKVRQAIELTGRIRGGPPELVHERAATLIEALDIGEWSDTLGVKLSGGVKRLVGFAMVTVWPGQVVILDEPTNDVDPLRRRLLWQRIRALGEEHVTVFLVTHNVLEAEKSVDRLAVIDQGRIIASGTPSSLKVGDRGRLRLQLMLTPGVATPPLPRFIITHTRVSHQLVTVIEETDAAAAISWAQQLMADESAEEYGLAATTLEDVYIRLTGDLGGDGMAQQEALQVEAGR
jgi:ABC-2 type transport system ATP-binding protein